MTDNCEIFDPECFELHEGFLGLDEADTAMRQLWRDLDWMQKEISLFGRKVMQPRLIAWYGDPLATYSYSGLSLSPAPWHPLLLQWKLRLEEFTGHRFNSVLANAYRDGRDSMGWHRDNETELGRQPFIASLSLGAERRFLVRRLPGAASKPRARAGKGSSLSRSASQGINLQHGSLLVMKNSCQEKYQHALPKTKRAKELRINLTFRNIRPQAPV
jgi:alkylated DNA repair dioxygenase AlkB